VWEENYRVYGARKAWKQLNREGIQVVRCTVARLMRDMGLRGVTHGKKVKTTLRKGWTGSILVDCSSRLAMCHRLNMK
jgi:transposase InsO family protein